jgi:hypothetical protein
VKLQWLLGNFADPQHELSPAEQREVSRLAHRKHMPPRHFFILTLLALLVPVGLAFKVALPTVLDWLGLGGRTLPFIAGVAVIIALFWVWCAWVECRSIRRGCPAIQSPGATPGAKRQACWTSLDARMPDGGPPGMAPGRVQRAPLVQPNSRTPSPN